MCKVTVLLICYYSCVVNIFMFFHSKTGCHNDWVGGLEAGFQQVPFVQKFIFFMLL